MTAPDSTPPAEQTEPAAADSPLQVEPAAATAAADAPPQVEPAAPTVEPPAPVAAPARRNGLLGWLLVRDELARAQADAKSMTGEQRACLQRAKVAFEMGELALSPGNAVRSGSAAALATNLFRQAIYWTLLTLEPTLREHAPAEAWSRASSELRSKLAPEEAARNELESVMRSTFVELGEAPLDGQRARAESLHRVAQRAVAQAQRVPWQLEWSKLKRLTRLGLAFVVLLVPIVVVVALLPGKPDLAKGKPWHVSSIGIECHPEKSDCGGVTTDILFHTKLEKDPWFEYDFGRPMEFSSLTIKNRSDFGPERAVPLVVEVSNDDKHFRQIARREDSFSTWKPSFTPQKARYLRLRVARESMLHLEGVQVHP